VDIFFLSALLDAAALEENKLICQSIGVFGKYKYILVIVT
jgi:hypothetical protein